MKSTVFKSALFVIAISFFAACTSSKNSRPKHADVQAEASDTEFAASSSISEDTPSDAEEVLSVDSDEVDVAVAPDDLDAESGDWNEEYQ